MNYCDLLHIKKEGGMKKVTTLHTDISNDGGRADESSIQVKWFSDYVEVILSGCEQEDEFYKIDYN